MLEWLARYWLEVLFSGVLAGGGYLIRRLWKKQQEEEARQKSIKEAIIALLRAELVHAYYQYYERGWISLHGLEAAQKMYDEYHRLGGNGTVTKLMEDLKELPVRDKLAVIQEQQEQEEAETKN